MTHGTANGYRRGCRCLACREAHRIDTKERRWRKYGPPAKRSPVDRFWIKVCKTDDCWLWTASLDSAGYGLFRANGKMWKAHRFVYQASYGFIPEGLTIDHLCGVRNCVRPDHLEAVTQRENTARGAARRTHCRRGHEYTAENTYWTRACRACWKVKGESA